MAASLSYTWLGHATLLFQSPGGRRVLVDPWLTDNPACPPAHKRVAAADLVLITHGHDDHTGDSLAVARDTGATVVACPEICHWLERKGATRLAPMNIGGTQQLLGLTIAMVPALHSSSVVEDGRSLYLGEAAGYVIRFEDGLTVYVAGDTGLFGDMRLIGEIHRPAIAFLPIGDRYTMGPDAAARACQLLGVQQVVPIHHGTFPSLTGTPDRLRTLVEPLGIQVIVLQPGETAR